MIFALRDFLQYRSKKGRFSRSYKASFMGAAFQGGLSPKAIAELRPGDLLFIETLNSWISWLVMYMTKSEISHVAFYVGDHSIAHATLSGVAVEPIEVLYDQETRILPFIWPMPDEKREQILPFIEKEYADTPYGWHDVAKKAIRIFFGRDWRYFRWSFLIDLILILLVLDVPLLVVYERLFFSWLIIPYLSVVAINWLFGRFKPLAFDKSTVKPHEFMEFVMGQGGTAIFDAYELSQQKMAEQTGHKKA